MNEPIAIHTTWAQIAAALAGVIAVGALIVGGVWQVNETVFGGMGANIGAIREDIRDIRDNLRDLTKEDMTFLGLLNATEKELRGAITEIRITVERNDVSLQRALTDLGEIKTALDKKPRTPAPNAGSKR